MSFKVGDIVVFRKIVNGKFEGVEKTPYIVVETNLKYGEVDLLLKNIETNENVYTSTRGVCLREEKDNIYIQLTLF